MLEISPAEAAALARERYGLEAEARPLVGYEDRNFLLEEGGGRRFVLKLSARPRAMVSLQIEVLRFLARHAPELPVPRPLTDRCGEEIVVVTTAEGVRRGWLLTYLAGEPMAELPASAGLREDFGRFLARLDRALAGCDHPALDHQWWWDAAQAPAVIRPRLGAIRDRRRRTFLDALTERLEERVLPRLATLPRQLIHGDGNGLNVLVDRGGSHVVGLIDFGDLVRTARVCELAVALAYGLSDVDDPLAAGADVVRGYHAELPLVAAELELLFDLIRARLAMIVAMAARQAVDRPDEPYLRISERPAWELLERLSAIAPADARAVFAAVCPGLDDGGSVARARRSLLPRRRRLIGPSLSLAYREPLEIVRGAGAYLYDPRGRAYLDCVNNVAHVGHCHPAVVRAAAAQMARLETNTRYLHHNILDYAERLTATLPPPLSVCYFVCSGSEANELALRLARAHTGRRDVLTLDGAYHGNTSSLVAISPYKYKGPGGSGAPPWVHEAPIPDPYRGRWRGDDPRSGERYAAAVAETVAAAIGAGREIAAFFHEPLLGCGGQIVPPDGYLRRAYRAVRAAGGICVADEVQIGLGRVGTHFWAFETQGVVPDVVTLGKPLGNGHPLAAVVTTPEIARSFANGMEYFNTFGGNPVSCAVGLAVLEVIEREGLQENARRVGELLHAGLERLASRHPLIGDVRGRGLFLGVELVRDRATLEPAAQEATELVETMKTRGVLLSTDGPLHNVIKIKPPLVFSPTDAELLLAELDAALATGPSGDG